MKYAITCSLFQKLENICCFVALGWSGRAPPLWWCCPPTCGPPGRRGARRNCESIVQNLQMFANNLQMFKRKMFAHHLQMFKRNLQILLHLLLSPAMSRDPPLLGGCGSGYANDHPSAWCRRRRSRRRRREFVNPPSLVWRWCATSWPRGGGWRTPSAACTTSYGWESGTR